ncbi:MAG TPA: DUF4440 domain-containing protein [Gemmatimonadota bacterium]|nr:DUF4440 domain-containing protein [Gemmatimonadota bacterium]
MVRKPNATILALTVIVACLLVGVSCLGRTTREGALRSLVESGPAFAPSTGELGVRDGFLAYMAEDAIVFRPRAVNARQFLSAQPATPGLLSWEPVFADISESGDLGFTTGPWNYRTHPDSAPVAYGQYFSFWKLQEDGSWKVMLDHGTSHPPAEGSLSQLTSPEHPRYDDAWSVSMWGREAEITKLLEVDGAFSAASAARGSTAALSGYVDADVRTLRNGMQPLTGAESLRNQTSLRPGSLTWVPAGGDVSASGDLGYTYGEYTYTPADSSASSETGIYVRAWRRTSVESWRVIVDIMTPLPDGVD